MPSAVYHTHTHPNESFPCRSILTTFVCLQPGDKVLCNAFSFTAVPSAIHHAGGQPCYVESTDAYVMCPNDLRAKIALAKKVHRNMSRPYFHCKLTQR